MVLGLMYPPALAVAQGECDGISDVAPISEHERARSNLETWLPFFLIFSATYLTGTWVVGHSSQMIAEPAGDAQR